VPDRLALDSIVKRFGATTAVRGASLQIARGEVVGLVGANGAGKSTLLGVMGGVHRPDEGTISIDGEAVRWGSPSDALDHGISTLQQHVELVPGLKGWENVVLGAWPTQGPQIVSRRRARASVKPYAEALGLSDEALDAVVATLPLAIRRLLTIAQAMYRRAWLIMLDEPTDGLTKEEAKRLHATIERLRESGHALVYVSHRLQDVLDVSDRVVVIRDGQVAGELPGAGSTLDQLLELMTGGLATSAVGGREATPRTASAVPRLAVEGLSAERFEDLDLTVEPGEIVGIAGVEGSGQESLMRILAGTARQHAGSIRLDGDEVGQRSLARRVEAGIALCPGDRKNEGYVGTFSVRQNITLSSLRRCSTAGLVPRQRAERAMAREQIERLGVRTASDRVGMGALSGGNQQKVILGRLLATGAKLLLLEEPTSGVDVVSKREIHEKLHAAAADGASVLAISSELEELLALCDRIVVMGRGRIQADVAAAELDLPALTGLVLRAASGAGAEDLARR
jgi:ABC-type sugar transport system ATPase subunit